MFGEYGIQALEPGWITARQIEAARIAMTRHIRRGGKVWINIFPDKPVTEKPAETRMGSGKGNPEHWVAVVAPGRIMFELSYPDADVARGRPRAGHPEAADQGPLREPGGGPLMTQVQHCRRRPPRPVSDDALVGEAGRGEGRPAEAPLPPGHRPARQPRRAPVRPPRDRPHQHRDPRRQIAAADRIAAGAA